MAVHAHPDDESSKGAATYAHYTRQGAEVMVVSCTGGEAGDILNEGLAERAMAERDLPGLRRIEMARAQAVMGVQHRWLGYVDSGMAREDGSLPPASFASIPVEVSAEPLIRLVREFRPHVLVAYDENGGYPHPDHIQAHVVAMEAWRESGVAGSYPDAGEPWEISKLYFDRIFNGAKLRAVREHLVADDAAPEMLEAVDEMLGWMGDRPDLATTHVHVADHFEARDRALLSHASQVAPDSSFFRWPRDLQQRAWPFEDFQLVESRVPRPTRSTTSSPESSTTSRRPSRDGRRHRPARRRGGHHPEPDAHRGVRPGHRLARPGRLHRDLLRGRHGAAAHGRHDPPDPPHALPRGDPRAPRGGEARGRPRP
ncbi:Mycothiol S-conjugate amidase [Clavibacter michiganensis subsp. michiganensis]|uniref:Mycothiol S-conjugate amidase n=1 Tax=Clavibacter michiganensis subsp. michiganensis TaxID=33013 RepID=A0A251XK08_CLAMM|nr:Mycothiol S-conjugate amidase [Clavibacter michiganensis subsp. michiganensis]OUE03519.1 Mycothiol S-conjugate amidase [Clavibacter michiganensis subsp. michiganensis]